MKIEVFVGTQGFASGQGSGQHHLCCKFEGTTGLLSLHAQQFYTRGGVA